MSRGFQNCFQKFFYNVYSPSYVDACRMFLKRRKTASAQEGADILLSTNILQTST